MAANETRESPIKFDLFELDTNGGQLRRGGLLVDLPPQALRILALLTAHPGQLVTRKAIKDALWPGETYGDFDSRMNFAIKKLREALGDTADHPRYIQTERKAGYRFIAAIRESQPVSSSGPDSLDLPAARLSTSAESRFGRSAFLAALVVLAAIAAIGSFVLRGRATDPAATAASVLQPTSMDDSKPEIYSVTPILPQARQRIVVRGRGFGLHVPYAQTDSPYIAIRDDTARWSAGRMVPHNWDEVMLDVESWKDEEIVITGFSGDYGKKGWQLTEGDRLEIAVWNPQNGVGPARYSASVVFPDQ